MGRINHDRRGGQQRPELVGNFDGGNNSNPTNFLLYEPGGSYNNYINSPVTIGAEVRFTAVPSNLPFSAGGRAGIAASNPNPNLTGTSTVDESFIAIQTGTYGNGSNPYSMTQLNENVAYGGDTGSNVWSLNTPYWIQETWDPTTNTMTDAEMWSINTNGVIGSTPIVNLGSFASTPANKGYVGFDIFTDSTMTVSYVLIQGTGLPSITVGTAGTGSGGAPPLDDPIDRRSWRELRPRRPKPAGRFALGFHPRQRRNDHG